MNLYQQFSERARERPDAVAVAAPDGEDRTYRDLEREAAAVASWLDGRADPGDRVAVYMMDCPSYVSAVLGAWRAGCAVTPVNYRFGPDLVEFVLSDVRPRALVTDDVFENVAADAADAAGVERFARGHAGGAFAADVFDDPDDAPTPVARAPDDTAVVMHTSGTTGRPKGVVQTHHNVDAQVRGGVDLYDVSPDDTAVVSVPLFHVGGLHGATLMSLFAGGSVAVQPAWDAAEWARYVEATDATFTGLVPAMIVDALNTEAAAAYDTSSLHLCFYGGSPTPEPVLREFGERFEVDRLLDYYGQTEVAGLAVTYGQGEERRPGVMGRPIPCLEARVVDVETGDDLPDGEAGELLLRGDTVTPGYWERPERTDASFTDGWLHTDDVVVRDDDGFLRFVDRVDDIVLSGGEKVAPSAVEDALSGMEGVEAVAVFGTPHDRLGEAVTAAVVPADPDLSRDDVAAFCDAHGGLADYEKPRRVAFVDSFPRTGSQKIDKVALAERFDDEFTGE